MKKQQLIDFLVNAKIAFRENLDLRNFSYLKTGGQIEILIQPETNAQLIRVVTKLYADHISYRVIGNTSNILFKDQTNLDIVISTRSLSLFEIDVTFPTAESCNLPSV